MSILEEGMFGRGDGDGVNSMYYLITPYDTAGYLGIQRDGLGFAWYDCLHVVFDVEVKTL